MSDIIRLCVPTPFPVGPVNVYLLGSPPVMVDSGSYDGRALEALTRQLGEHGYQFSDLVGVVLTHAHPDHSGLAGYIADNYNVPVYIHPQEMVGLNTGSPYLDRRREVLVYAGSPDTVVDQLMEIVEDSRQYIYPVMDKCQPIARQLQIDDDLWQVLETPGHSAGHISLYLPERKLLLSGDCLLRDVVPAPGLELVTGDDYRSHVDTYDATMALLEKLEVVTTYPGHGRQFMHHQFQIDRYREHAARRELRVLNMLRSGRGSAYEITMRINNDLEGAGLYVALASNIAYLESLSGRGIVAGRQQDGVVVYEVVSDRERSDRM